MKDKRLTFQVKHHALRLSLCVMASLLLFVACFFEPGPLEGRACVTDLDCPGGALCAEGFCALSPPDSSADGGAEGEDEATPGDDVSPGDVPQGPRDVESPQDVSDTSGDALDVPEDVVEPGEDISPGDVPPDGPAPNACGGFAELSGAPGQACDVCRGVLVCDGVDALVCETDLPVADAIIVDTVEDVINSPQRCSLRDAVRSVNEGRALGGCDAPVGEVPRVLLSLPGTYALTRVGRLENNGLTGDLDVLGALSVQSCRQGTSIHGQGADRIFHVQGRLSRLTLIGVSLRRGEVSGGDAVARQGGTSGGVGGAIFNEGALTLRDVVLRNNVVRGGAGADGVSNAGGGGGGGGGGGAFGGAIFNNGGTVTLDNVVFQDNEAVGGRGGDGVINNGFFSGDGGGGGSIGGDGGGGTGVDARGDDGEFGGGGGGGGATNSGSSGGDGGFGGGGGGGGGRTTGGLTGPGGVSRFAGGQGGRGCCSAGGGGGGGGALGGALFNLNGVVSVTDVSFERNVALGGEPGANAFGGADGTEPEGGLGLGGAVFERQASNDFSQASFDGNSADQGANVARQ